MTRLQWLQIWWWVPIPVSALACSGPPLPEEEGPFQLVAAVSDKSASLQTTEEAEEADALILAESRGWTLQQALENQRAVAEVRRVGTVVAERRPEVFIGTAVSEEPGGPATLYIKGPADAELLALTVGASVPIQISDNHRFSQKELLERQDQISDKLKAAGFRSFAVGINLRNDSIDVQVTRRSDVPLAAEDPLRTLPALLRNGTRVTAVRDTPVYVPDTAFGGMRMSVGCTSAWTVVDDQADRYISSAGHCRPSANIIHPGEGNHPLTFVDEHQGDFGDMEIYTTTAELTPQFFTDTGVVRTVRGTRRLADIIVGEAVCLYSAVQGRRLCSRVEMLQINCEGENGIIYRRMVGMDEDEAVGGDSGGGWASGDIAYGIHGGTCGDIDAWSLAANLVQTFVVIPASG